MSGQGVDQPKQIRPLHEFLRAALPPRKDGHVASSVILTDEPPKWYDKSEDENYDKVQEVKNVLTQRQHNYVVLKMKNLHDDLDESDTLPEREGEVQ